MSQTQTPTASGPEVAADRPFLGVVAWVQVAAVAWCTWLPVSLSFVLYPALLAVLVSSLLLVRGRRLAVPRAWRVAFAVYAVLVVVQVVRALVLDTPGLVHQTALWVGVPLIWGSWALSLDARQARRTLHAVLWTGTLSGLLVVGVALQAVLDVDLYPAFLVDLQNIFHTVSTSRTLEMSYLGLSALIPVAALAITAALLPGRDPWLPSRRFLVVSAAVLLTAGIVSGRRGFMVVVLLVLVVAAVTGLVLVLRDGGGRRGALRYAGAVLLAAAAVVVLCMTPLGTNVPGPTRGVLGLPEPTSGPAGSTDDGGPVESLDALGDTARRDQAAELLASWRDAPVLGHGLGAPLESGFERSEDRPWMFEMEPLQLLHGVGLLGLAVLAGSAVLLASTVRQAWRTGRHRRSLLAGTAATLGLLVASATNPYLQAPGHGWALFVALGLGLAVLRASAPEAADPPAAPRA